MRTVTATQAIRDVFKLRRSVRAGKTVRIAHPGEPVATVAPAKPAGEGMEQVKGRLLTRLETVEPHWIPAWTRDELYD